MTGASSRHDRSPRGRGGAQRRLGPGMGIDLDPDLSTLAAASVYLIVFGFVFVESGLLVGFFLPGDTILFGAGLAAAAAGQFRPAAGLDRRHAGRRYRRRCSRLRDRAEARPAVAARRADKRGINSGAVARAERFYEAYGWFAIVGARWIPWIRTFTPIVAGIGRMPYPRFLSANVVGALAWAVGLTVLGYFSYQVPALRYSAYAVGGFFILSSLVGGAMAVAHHRRSPGPPGTALADPAGR